MINVNKMLASLSRSSMMKGSGGSLLSGALAGGLAGSLMSKSGKKTGKKALKVGALAAVGGIAWKAYKSYSEQQARDRAFNKGKYQEYGMASSQGFAYSPDSLREEQFDDVVRENNSEGQMLLLRAMVSAAHADGHIDQTERMKIFDQVDGMDLGPEDKASLFDEMRKPMSLDALVASIPCSEAAAEVYAISALAIDLRASESRVYLDKLAKLLCLPSELQFALESSAHDASLSVTV